MTEQATSSDTRDRPVVSAPVADPAPLGFAAFAVTIFLLSAANAGWMSNASGDAWLSYAFAYGGLVVLLAGMWEFRNGNTFGATAFSTYGAFWIGLALWAELVAPKVTSSTASSNDVAWILLAFAIFNTYMLLWSIRVNVATFLVFATLEATEIILIIAFFKSDLSLTKIGGYVGVLTAACAWSASAAGIFRGMSHSSRRSAINVPPPLGIDVPEKAAPETDKLQIVAERLEIQVIHETIVYDTEGRAVIEDEGDYYLIVREPERMLVAVDVPGADRGVFWRRADAENAASQLSVIYPQYKYEIYCVGSNDIIKGVIARYKRGEQAP